MTEERVKEIFSKARAVITDTHVVYASWRHGKVYVNKDAIYPHVGLIAELCGDMIAPFCVAAFGVESVGVDFDTIVGPEKGGIILSQWAAYNSVHVRELGKDIYAVYAEKETVAIPDPEGKERKCFAETGRFVFNRGYVDFVRDKRVLVVEDVLTTGTSARKTVEAVRVVGGEVIGVSALCNRGGVTKEDVGDLPKLTALLNVRLETWAEEECSMCKQGVPINTQVGKGREYLARKGK